MPPPVKKVAKVGAIGVGTGVAVFAVPPLLGFTASGVAAGELTRFISCPCFAVAKFWLARSVAAAIQSAVYGAAVPAGSLFSIMQSVGATATIVPALVAGASATGIAGAVEAGQGQGQGQGQGPDDNGEQREDGDKEAQEDKENEDLEKQSEGENQNPVNEGRSQRASLRERLHKLVQDRSPYDQGILQVSSPDEDQGSISLVIKGIGAGAAVGVGVFVAPPLLGFTTAGVAAGSVAALAKANDGSCSCGRRRAGIATAAASEDKGDDKDSGNGRNSGGRSSNNGDEGGRTGDGSSGGRGREQHQGRSRDRNGRGRNRGSQNNNERRSDDESKEDDDSDDDSQEWTLETCGPPPPYEDEIVRAQHRLSTEDDFLESRLPKNKTKRVVSNTEVESSNQQERSHLIPLGLRSGTNQIKLLEDLEAMWLYTSTGAPPWTSTDGFTNSTIVEKYARHVKMNDTFYPAHKVVRSRANMIATNKGLGTALLITPPVLVLIAVGIAARSSVRVPPPVDHSPPHMSEPMSNITPVEKALSGLKSQLQQSLVDVEKKKDHADVVTIAMIDEKGVEEETEVVAKGGTRRILGTRMTQIATSRGSYSNWSHAG
ncbi:hypothetical protein RHS01_00063 [Rhizoctonia solani]|uniref:Uncharacterized protein n=1 Tax=Rhizoctonia solani TaxID=456999 RepID=A0A8H7IMN7_9AGAM|nr:hypothetical protein RHS01_00063 [Rhizoctonia solani]